jgi:hypothetical protein
MTHPTTPDHFDDDENVKAMRDTAWTTGLTKLLLDVWRTPASVGDENRERLGKALDLLGQPERLRTRHYKKAGKARS